MMHYLNIDYHIATFCSYIFEVTPSDFTCSVLCLPNTEISCILTVADCILCALDLDLMWIYTPMSRFILLYVLFIGSNTKYPQHDIVNSILYRLFKIIYNECIFASTAVQIAMLFDL